MIQCKVPMNHGWCVSVDTNLLRTMNSSIHNKLLVLNAFDVQILFNEHHGYTFNNS